MKVPLNAVEQYVGFELPAFDELVQKIGAQLGAVDEVIDLSEQYSGIMVVKVVSCEPHPDADKLNVCLVDDGGNAQGIDRDDKGLVPVVCGAPNVHEGMLAAWLPPGSTVPSTVSKQPFVLEARELRGVVSNGMLASPKELGLGDNHQGILEIDRDAQPGDDFAKLYKLDGHIIDIENKMFTHRPDCFGVLGVAREIAGILHQPFKSPDWYVPGPPPVSRPSGAGTENGEALELAVKNELPELVPRFTAVTMSGIAVRPSPVWLQVALTKFDQKPVNNIVDLTNFYMLVSGQPLHAYDYDKVKALSNGEAALVIRNPKPSEKIKLLNGKEIEPRPEAIMIATDQQLIGIGGVMGGSDTEVGADTKNIILECASFDMYSIRRTSMAHGLFTDAVTRFTKGQSPLQNLAVIAKIVDEIRRFADGRVAGPLIDDNHLDAAVQDRQSLYPPVKVMASFINDRLGLQLPADEMKKLLENVEFTVEANGDDLTVTAPFWRTDIELREDVVEEIGRLYGYDHLPLELPKRDLTPAPRDPLLQLKAQVRATLAKAGANEVLTYSFVHGNLLDKVGQDKQQAFQLSNALSPDLQYYRLSLMPSLLDKIHPNIKAGYDQFALFELGKAHVQSEPDPFDPAVPKEVNALGLVFAAGDKAAQRDYAGAAFYEARKYLTDLLIEFHAQGLVKLESLDGADLYKNPWLEELTKPFEPARAAVLRDDKGLVWGVVGEFKALVRASLKLPTFSAGFELDPLLFLQNQDATNYAPLPRFPKVTQDITLKVAADVPYQDVFDCAWAEAQKAQPENCFAQLSPIDIYQPEDDAAHKNVTLRLSIASYDRTLTDTEVTKLLDAVSAVAQEKIQRRKNLAARFDKAYALRLKWLMEITTSTALTFDDVLLKPGYAGFLRSEIRLDAQLTKKIKLKTPLVSAPMDTVTESRLAIALAKSGGIGIIHRNLTVKHQVAQVAKVKQAGHLVGAAVGSSPGYEARVKALVRAGADVIVVDSAHGFSKFVIAAVKFIKQNHKIEVIAGNVATAEGAEALVEAGADGLRVGMGPGAICTTRLVSGMGVPQLTAILETAAVARQHGVPVIADGGINYFGDITKALAAGASTVMMGRLFAATEESPGELVKLRKEQVPGRFQSIINGAETYAFKGYRGMGSPGAMEQGRQVSSEDEFHGKSFTAKTTLVPEGVEGLVPCSGPLKIVVANMLEGVRSGFYYIGARTIDELWETAQLRPITSASLSESHPHDLFVTSGTYAV